MDNFLPAYFLVTLVFSASLLLLCIYRFLIIERPLRLRIWAHSSAFAAMIPALLLLDLASGNFLQNGQTGLAVVFIVLGISGIAGELFFSLTWQLFFPKKIWDYHVISWFRGMTSPINFFPWAVGGFMFLAIRLIIVSGLIQIGLIKSAPVVSVELTLRAFGLYSLLTFFSLITAKLIFKKPIFNARTYFLFCIGLISVVVFLSLSVSWVYSILFLAFAICGFVAEYAYGKIFKQLFGQPLWTYNYWTIDKNHTSFTNLIPFGVAGIYFCIIVDVLLKILGSMS